MSDRIAVTRSCGCVEEWTRARIKRVVQPQRGYQTKGSTEADLIRDLERSKCWRCRIRDGEDPNSQDTS